MARTALVVDDSRSMRQMVAHTLRQAGFNVVEGEHGKAALEQLARTPVQIVITDLNMPVMDGLTFVGELRRLPAYRHTPVLMLTTEFEEEKKRAGRAAGATGWIVKPFDPQRLLAVIGRVLP